MILDQRMPGLYGIEVATEIHAEDPEQAVILFSAYIDTSTEERAREAGITACIPKQDVLTLPSHSALVSACPD